MNPMKSRSAETMSSLGYLPFMCALLALSVLIHGTALAKPIGEEEKYNHMLDDRFSLWIGGFFPKVESTIRLDSALGPGDEISFENFLGLEDSKTTLWGGFRWRISRRNQLEFEFNNLNRSGSVSASTDPIDVGEETIQAGARIDTTFDLSLARITYGFSVIRKQKHDLAVKGGVHMAFTSLEIDAMGAIIDVDDPTNNLCGQLIDSECDFKVESDDYTVPLPHFGLSYTYAFTPHWGLRAQGLGFAIKINDIKGVMTELDLDLHYQPWKHVGIGGGFRFWDLNIEDTGDSFLQGEFDYKYYGPALYVLGSF
jgi:hypothetical protein